MLNWLTSISSSILLYIIAGLLTTTLLFGGLSWYLKGVADDNKQALGVAQNANSSLENSLNQKTQSCDATDAELAKYQASKESLVETKTNTISAIDAIPKKPVKAPTQATQNETAVVDIDARLPDTLISLLKQSSGSVKGSVTDNAR